MNQKKLFIVATIIIIAGVAYFVFDRKSGEPTNQGITQMNGDSAYVSNQSEQNNFDSSNLRVDQAQPTTTPDSQTKIKNNMHLVSIKTNMGEIQFETYDSDAPKTVDNFITLANRGFYDTLIFHRVIDGFMIQGGDPNGNGSGGPGYKFEDELNPAAESYKAGYKKGVVAMANSGADTNGSQFFIMVADYPLPHKYTIFGKVIKGQEVADAIAKVAKDTNDKPLSPVSMEKVTVSEIK